MEDMERLAVAQAVYKVVADAVSTRGGKGGAPNLRTKVDDRMREEYMSTGSDRVRLRVNGQEVGTVSVKLSKPVDGVEPEIADASRLIKWLRESDGGRDAIQRLVFGDPGKVLAAATADGELPDGCRMRKVVEPARITGTVLRVDPQKVAAALGDALPEAVAGLLEGGE